MSAPNPQSTKASPQDNLLPQHRELIEASAISTEVAAERGYFSASEAKELTGMFGPSQRLAPALVIPVFDAYGERVFFQLRPDDPRVKNGRILKYESPAGVKMAIDVPPATRPHLHNPKVTLWITEGIRKADSLASIGLRAVALLGVWNWRGKGEEGGTTALPDWEAIALNDQRKVVVCFDSDAFQNPGIHKATERLGRWLEKRGAEVSFVYLPCSDDGSKVGVDDFLAAGNGREELLARVVREWRPLPSDAKSNGKPPVGPLLPTEQLLGAVAEVLDRYVHLPSRRAALAISLWVLHSWALDAAYATPYLTIQSPVKRSGKTRLQETLELVVRDPWRIAAASESAMFRKIEDQRPTLILDEVDAVFGGRSESTEGLRAVLNAGNRPGAAVARVVGEGANLKTVDFSVYSAKVLAGIGTERWPDTILDRSIRITLKRKTKGESVARFRHRKALAETEELRAALAVWAAERTQALHDAEPELPLELDDRAAEGWEALFAIADLAGAKFGEQARLAAVGLAREAPEDEDGHGVLLLQALKGMFTDTAALHTEAIVAKLNESDELPFGAHRKGLGIDSRGLAKLLRPFGVKPKTLRFGEVTAKGYNRDGFEEPWERYCTEPNSGAKRDSAPDGDAPAVTSVTTAPQSQKPAIPDPSQTADVTDSESAANPHSNADVTDVSDRNAQTGGEHINEPIVAALQAQLGGES
jgi:Protein of unknown function (DUF3631)/Domain of unknown function (DUF3854)